MNEQHSGNHYLGELKSFAPFIFAAVQLFGLPTFRAHALYYQGYTIEQRCLKAPYFEEREHRAIVLAKQPSYFEEKYSSWYHLLEGVKSEVPELVVAGEDPIKFNIISTAGHEVSEGNPPDVIDEPGVEVIGRQNQDMWIQTVGRSKVMIGIGNPAISPSRECGSAQWRELCF